MFNSFCVADGLSCASIVITIEGLTIYHTKHLYDPHHSHDLSTKMSSGNFHHDSFSQPFPKAATVAPKLRRHVVHVGVLGGDLTRN